MEILGVFFFILVVGFVRFSNCPTMDQATLSPIQPAAAELHQTVTTQGTHPAAKNKSHFYKSLSSTSLLPPHFLILSNPGDENKKSTTSSLLKSSIHFNTSLAFPHVS